MSIIRLKLKSYKVPQARSHLGWRPPRDYQCRLPVSGICSKNIKKAIDFVLDTITRNCFEDIVKIQNSVEAIHITNEKKAKNLGYWLLFEDLFEDSWTGFLEKYKHQRCLKKGIVILHSKLSKSLNLSKIVFAHELGHVVRNDCSDGQLIETGLSRKDFLEAAANSCLIRWGMKELMKKPSVPKIYTLESLSPYFCDYIDELDNFEGQYISKSLDKKMKEGFFE